MNYYYSIDGTEVLGPHFLDDILEHYRSGALPNTTNICAEGQENWQPIAVFVQPETPGLLGATFSVQPIGGKRVEVDSLPKAQARKLYQFGQEMEEQVHHQRRQRDLEDKRAAAGGIQLGGAGFPGVAPAEDPMQKLQQLKSLHEQGLISPQEYETKKAEILSRF